MRHQSTVSALHTAYEAIAYRNSNNIHSIQHTTNTNQDIEYKEYYLKWNSNRKQSRTYSTILKLRQHTEDSRLQTTDIRQSTAYRTRGDIIQKEQQRSQLTAYITHRSLNLILRHTQHTEDSKQQTRENIQYSDNRQSIAYGIRADKQPHHTQLKAYISRQSIYGIIQFLNHNT